ncbi:MAG: hypothetical protein ABSE73_33230, partial [Planctomycetota bacterium]
ILPKLLILPGQDLAKALGKDLPPDAQPAAEYTGAPRLIVPTVRGSLAAGEALQLKAIVLSAQAPREANLYWRPLGQGDFAAIPLTHVNRGVYQVKLPAPGAAVAALEYYVKAVMEGGAELVFPASAPGMNQTVVVSR